MTLLAYRPLTSRAATAADAERKPGDDNPGPLDWALAALALAALTYPLTVGWVLPAICLAFVAYAFFGGLLAFGWDLGHKGYDLERLVGQTYMGIEGLFGVPLDVAATYIVLFTIYGAVLEYSGAGRFFIDVSFAAFGTRSGVDVDTKPLGWLLLRYGYYFSSLILIVVFMAFGLSPFRAVLYATVVALLLGFLRRETRWTPRRLFDCLAAGTLGVPAGGGGVRRRRGHRGRGVADRAGPQGQLADRRRRRSSARPWSSSGSARKPPTCSSSTTRSCPR